MKVTINKEDNNIIAIIEGSIDSKTAPDLQQSLLPVISDTHKVIIDLSLVTFVSSAGLRVLLMVYRHLKTKEGKVVLVGLSEEIKDVMFMTGFITFFEICPSVKEALISS